MNSREGKRKLPPVPAWFEARRVLSGSDVLVNCKHTHFSFRNQTVVVGRGGLLLLASLPLREGSPVRLEVSADGQRWNVEATVAQALPGWGTVFQLTLPGGWRWEELKAWLTDEGRQ